MKNSDLVRVCLHVHYALPTERQDSALALSLVSLTIQWYYVIILYELIDMHDHLDSMVPRFYLDKTAFKAIQAFTRTVRFVFFEVLFLGLLLSIGVAACERTTSLMSAEQGTGS